MALLSELVIVRTVFESLEPVHFGDTLEKLKTISPIERVIIKNIMTVMKIVLTTRATSATPGRSFSVARRVKTSLRSSMTQKCLNALAILHSHVDIVPTQRRHRYVPNETPKASRCNVTKTSQWYVSTTFYWNIVTTSQKDVTTTSLQYVSTTSQKSLKWNTQRRLSGTLPRRISGTYPRRPISTSLQGLL